MVRMIMISGIICSLSCVVMTNAAERHDNRLLIRQAASVADVVARVHDRIEQDRQLQQECLLTLESDADADKKAAAIYLLGLMRYHEAAKIVALNMALRPANALPGGEPPHRPGPPWTACPARDALLMMGVAAAPGIIGALADIDDPTIRRELSHIFSVLPTNEPGVMKATAVMDEAISNETDPIRKKRLESARVFVHDFR